MKGQDLPTRVANANTKKFGKVPVALIKAENLSDGAVRLYALLWDYSNKTDQSAWPARSTLAGDLHVSIDTIDRRVRELVSVNALSVEAAYRGDRQTSNIYTILPVENVLQVIHTGRTDAAPGGRTDAAPIEPEPEEQDFMGPVPEVRSERAGIEHGTGRRVTPERRLFATVGKPLDCAQVFASVGRSLPDRFDDELLERLASEILAKAATRVIDPTAYVIHALRHGSGLVDRGEWLIRADQLVDGRRKAGGF